MTTEGIIMYRHNFTKGWLDDLQSTNLPKFDEVMTQARKQRRKWQEFGIEKATGNHALKDGILWMVKTITDHLSYRSNENVDHGFRTMFAGCVAFIRRYAPPGRILDRITPM